MLLARQVPTVCTQEVVRAVPKLEAKTRLRQLFNESHSRDTPDGQVHEIIKEVPKIEYQAGCLRGPTQI